MDRLRKSFRDSFRKKKDNLAESSKAHPWAEDEVAVRSGSCSFPVRYLGCVEVFESRGMSICDEAQKVLKNSRRRALKSTLYVTSDGLRLVDETKALVLDQTIEKVSFCAPDRHHERGFSYICRDGTTRRWMCHGFHASKDSGERLSHAVGCAFSICLERKQKRDKDNINNVTMNFDDRTSTFTRCGSFRQSSLLERITDPQVAKPSVPPPVKSVHNPFAIERPRATPQLLQRQGSFRGFSGLNQASPFKRQLSLRIDELPSNLERQRAHSLGSNEITHRGGASVAPVSESVSSNIENEDTISEMCKEMSQGLKLLSSNDDPFVSPTLSPTNDTPINNLGKDVKRFAAYSVSSVKEEISSTTDFRNIPVVPPRKSSPNFSQLRSQSLAASELSSTNPNWRPVNSPKMAKSRAVALRFDRTKSFDTNTGKKPHDPFDVEWAAVDTRTTESNQISKSTNPFTQNTGAVKSFEVQL